MRLGAKGRGAPTESAGRPIPSIRCGWLGACGGAVAYVAAQDVRMVAGEGERGVCHVVARAEETAPPGEGANAGRGD